MGCWYLDIGIFGCWDIEGILGYWEDIGIGYGEDIGLLGGCLDIGILGYWPVGLLGC